MGRHGTSLALSPLRRYGDDMQSKASTVKEYLAGLPDDRRAAIEAVRAVILKNLHRDYEEGMQYGMIGYYIPHSIFPPGYHCDPKQPLPFGGLASQKSHMSFHLMATYMDSDFGRWFVDAWKRSGKKLDMGAACIRFKKLEDVALDTLGEAVRRLTPAKYIAAYTARLAEAKPGGGAKSSTKAASPKATTKKVASKKSALKKTASKKTASKKTLTRRTAKG
jgi:Domain of unknown function (DU1801)